MRPNVIVADRCPSGEAPEANSGSMVGLIVRGLSICKEGATPTLWISPQEGRHHVDIPVSDARIRVTRVSVPRETHHDYYLTVGAGRIWMVLHGLMDRLPVNACYDTPWEHFLEVNRLVATAVAQCAPSGSRVSVHDYTLLLAVPEIRRLRPDVSIVYVHHTPWPHSGQVSGFVARDILNRLAVATASCNAVCVSAHQWKKNLESWSVAVRVSVAHPGVDTQELKRRAQDTESEGCWAEIFRSASRRPIIAAVGRVDPSKNFDTLLRAWTGLVADGVSGVLCLHLVPTSRRMLPLYREFANALVTIAQEANSIRHESVIMVERQAQDEAWQLLQHSDVVVACSHSDGWNLVAAEACALGPKDQKLILSAKVGAAELLSSIALIVDNPRSHFALATAIRCAIQNGSSDGGVSRTDVRLPTPQDWWSTIVRAHESASSDAARHKP